MVIYTMGYAGRRLGDVVDLAKHLNALIVDVRLVPSSRAPGFAGAELEKALRGCYLWLPGFGNVNYRGGPVLLADFYDAEAALRERLGPESANVILLCACRDVAKCHRKLVAEKLAKRWGCEVVHLGRRGGGKNLSDFMVDTPPARQVGCRA